jgi:Uma2 family endonuclease
VGVVGKSEAQLDPPNWIESPEIVVEVLSPSSETEEIEKKRDAMSAKGAGEFWVCDQRVSVQFFDPHGSLANSKLCPRFPVSVASR